jgi:hypothetical protein
MKIKEKPEIFFIFFRFLGKPWQKIEGKKAYFNKKIK